MATVTIITDEDGCTVTLTHAHILVQPVIIPHSFTQTTILTLMPLG